MSEEPAVQLHGVSVQYRGAERPSLSNLDLTVQRGEWLTLIGPNGSGKTTLIHAIAGLVPSTGSIGVAGVNPRKTPPRKLARTVALMPQRPTVPAGMTVSDYVSLGRYAYASSSRVNDEIVDSVLTQLGIAKLHGALVSRLSGGQQQIVALARAPAQQPEVLLLDEPTSALDIGHAQRVLERADAVRHERGLTVISTVHDLVLAGQFGDRLGLVVDSRLVQVGQAEEILTADRISDVYGAQVKIVKVEGHAAVIPVRKPSVRTNQRE